MERLVGKGWEEVRKAFLIPSHGFECAAQPRHSLPLLLCSASVPFLLLFCLSHLSLVEKCCFCSLCYFFLRWQVFFESKIGNEPCCLRFLILFCYVPSSFSVTCCEYPFLVLPLFCECWGLWLDHCWPQPPSLFLFLPFLASGGFPCHLLLCCLLCFDLLVDVSCRSGSAVHGGGKERKRGGSHFSPSFFLLQ